MSRRRTAITALALALMTAGLAPAVAAGQQTGFTTVAQVDAQANIARWGEDLAVVTPGDQVTVTRYSLKGAGASLTLPVKATLVEAEEDGGTLWVLAGDTLWRSEGDHLVQQPMPTLPGGVSNLQVTAMRANGGVVALFGTTDGPWGRLITAARLVKGTWTVTRAHDEYGHTDTVPPAASTRRVMLRDGRALMTGTGTKYGTPFWDLTVWPSWGASALTTTQPYPGAPYSELTAWGELPWGWTNWGSDSAAGGRYCRYYNSAGVRTCPAPEWRVDVTAALTDGRAIIGQGSTADSSTPANLAIVQPDHSLTSVPGVAGAAPKELSGTPGAAWSLTTSGQLQVLDLAAWPKTGEAPNPAPAAGFRPVLKEPLTYRRDDLATFGWGEVAIGRSNPIRATVSIGRDDHWITLGLPVAARWVKLAGENGDLYALTGCDDDNHEEDQLWHLVAGRWEEVKVPSEGKLHRFAMTGIRLRDGVLAVFGTSQPDGYTGPVHGAGEEIAAALRGSDGSWTFHRAQSPTGDGTGHGSVFREGYELVDGTALAVSAYKSDAPVDVWDLTSDPPRPVGVYATNPRATETTQMTAWALHSTSDTMQWGTTYGSSHPTETVTCTWREDGGTGSCPTPSFIPRFAAALPDGREVVGGPSTVLRGSNQPAPGGFAIYAKDRTLTPVPGNSDTSPFAMAADEEGETVWVLTRDGVLQLDVDTLTTP